ncbi:MAG TPA: hypothetical protein VE978_12520 [Chitinophagales bacterium]|nr:hypothetical protein [Chitinophagales bacterium]
MKFSFVRLFATAAVVIGMMIAVSSCGTQRIGCPGAITKAPQEAPAHS